MSEKAHIIVGLWGGTIDNVRVHRTRKGAIESFEEFKQTYGSNGSVHHLTAQIRT